MQEAERLDITVEDAEIQRTLANIAERNQMTVEAMQRFFAQNGINLATLLEQVRAQIAWVKVVNRQIVPRVTVTVDQLDMAVERRAATRRAGVSPVGDRVAGRQPGAGAGGRAGRRPSGADPARRRQLRFARPTGVGRSQRRERRRRGLGPQQRDPARSCATESMREGEISDPISSPVGYYIFLLRDSG